MSELENGQGKKKIVFLPYKAAMWDSLESIWMAADEDEGCEAYVVPIPYYDKNPDGTLGKYYYEGDMFPDYVPVVPYDSIDLAEMRPDVIYIHNPYDQGNFVTSIAPEYYSDKLKKCTECLVYIPYYATTGGMSEAQSLCRAYINADYIVIQSERHRKFFDPRLPDKKFLPLGSPKFDRAIRLCSNPPEPPIGWKEKMAGKRVYFYNTSIAGMLADTEKFLLKMEYVFKCFDGRDDSCLVWRPHPLMESTFDSLRRPYRPVYDKLKQYFIQTGLGIYDDTPDIENTISLCDAYIGDSGTSVTALFGIVGKPLFILNNNINTIPEEDDWRGEIIKGFYPDGYDDWMVTQGNKLYHAPKHDYHYEFYCDLSDYSGGNYYNKVIEADGRVYVCPENAQDVLIISDHRIIKKIKLDNCIEQTGAFCNALKVGKYIFLIPYKYPAIVRINTQNDECDYIKGCNEVFVKEVQNEWRVGGCCVWKNYLLIASPADNNVLALESESMEAALLTIGSANAAGCIGMAAYDNGICMLPYAGTTVICWNPDSGELAEYDGNVKDLRCINRVTGAGCLDRVFSMPAIYGNEIVLPPLWGNSFVSIDMETGKKEEWRPPFSYMENGKNGYFISGSVGIFLRRTDTLGEGTFLFYCEPMRKLYDINLVTKEYREVQICFEKNELLKHEPGFDRYSDWLKYGCEEKALYSLNDFLDGVGKGRAFDRKSQIQAYGEITANNDGTCGIKIHDFITNKNMIVANGKRKYRTLIYGHRGASEYAPENTMEAFKLAYEMGADGIELDVQMTKDGCLVVAHDETVERVSNGQGYIRDMTLEQLKALNFNRTHPEYGDCRIPLLEEVLEWFGDKKFLFNMELKNSVCKYEGLEEETLKLVKKYGVLDRTIFSSFNHASMIKLKEMEPCAKVAFLTSEIQTDVVKYLHDNGVNIYHPAQYLLENDDIVISQTGGAFRTDRISALHRNNIMVNVWTVNAGSMMRKLCRLGVDGIITNKPDLGSEIRDDA